MRKLPSDADTVSRLTPVLTLVVFTLAPTITAPLGSVMLPTINPLLVCPNTLEPSSSVIRTGAMSLELILVIAVISSLRTANFESGETLRMPKRRPEDGDVVPLGRRG